MKKFMVGLAVGFVLGLGAAYGGFVAWNKYSPMLPWNQSAAKPTGTLPPSGIPTSLPIYQNAKLTTREYRQETVFLDYATNDPTETVIAYYRQQLPLLGWDAKVTNSHQSQLSTSEQWSGTKDNERCKIEVSSGYEGKGASIHIEYKQLNLKPVS